MPPQGLAYFPGIDQVVSASIDFVHGIGPSVAQITIAPQANFIGAGGTFSVLYDGTQLNWPDCKVDAASFERTSRGEIWRLSIFDRRWKWQEKNGGGAISGGYNLRKPNGTLLEDTERTPRQLAAILLDAMGETGYSVGDLPNDTRPLKDWDVAVPAEELATLCEGLGCRVVLQYLSNTVAIRVIGEGADLPTDLVLSNSLTIDPPERPDRLAIATGHVRFQSDMQLEAVGLDTDGTIKLIDQLSYKPSEGWTLNCIPFMTPVTASKQAQDLAKRTIFKWYRIVMPFTLPFDQATMGEEIEIESINQLSIEFTQVETTTDEDGNQVNKPAEVAGVYFQNLLGNNANNTDILTSDWSADGVKYPGSFTIDARRGIVLFSEPVYRNTEAGAAPDKVTAGAAQLRLRTALTARDDETLAWIRYARTFNNGSSFGTQARYVRHDEIVLTITPRYDSSYDLESVSTNQSEVDPQCDYYLAALNDEYQLRLPQSIHYPGLRAVELDGAIQHITFSVGAQGCTTTISRNTERREHVEPYEEMRLRQKIKQVVRKSSQQPAPNSGPPATSANPTEQSSGYIQEAQ